MPSNTDSSRASYVKNGRPRFFDDPVNDQLLAMIMALTGEVSVLRDRLDTHERLAAEKGLFTPNQISEYQPDESAEKDRARNRKLLLESVVSVLSEETARLRDV